MGALEQSLAGRRLGGLKAAFLVEASGACQYQGGEANALIQTANLLKQIYDIVGLPEMDSVGVASDSQIFYAQVKPGGVAGAIIGLEGKTDEIRSWLDALWKASPAAAEGTGGRERLAKIKKIATEYLKDFADMALMVQIKQAGVNEADPSYDSLEKLVAGLEKASAMIVGPSATKEMTGKLRDLLK